MSKIVKAIKRSFKELLAACKQDWVDSDFNEKNFPEPVAPDESEYEVYEYHFDETINGMDAFRKLAELGYRLCGPCRAMEYIADGHLDDQLNHPIIIYTRRQYTTLISGRVRWQYSMPVFDGIYGKQHCGLYGKQHCLRLYDLDGILLPNCGWLVLRKKTA